MAFQPMPLSRRPLPFDHPEWIFELKYDGFRSLAVIQNGRTELISRNGHPFSFDLRVALHAGKTVLDGEIVCVDEQGRSQFRDLLFHRGEPYFFAFDLLMSDGEDLRSQPLIDRKRELRRVLAGLTASRVRYADHVEREGIALYKRVCEMDLEGIVAKHSFGPYTSETKWFKIKNRNYSQMQGREELFERERHSEPVPGWHTCELACAEGEQNA
jgi:bifunctional non-homologous end joining protein LigD